MPESVRCPSCGADNPVAQPGAPFFCRGCHQILDAQGVLRSHGGEGRAATSDGSGPAGLFRSRYGPLGPGDITGPGAPRGVTGSATLGYLFCFVAGVGASAGVAWLGLHVVRLPVVGALLVGWLVGRVLAAGAGGGTPDRGLFGFAVLGAVVVAAFGVLRWAEYQAVAARESEAFSTRFGIPAADAVADPQAALARLSNRFAVAPRRVAPGSEPLGASIEEERERLIAARATGVVPSDGYDIHLLARTGYAGLWGHLRLALAEGERLRWTPSSQGVQLPGWAVAALWLSELALLAGTALRRIE